MILHNTKGENNRSAKLTKLQVDHIRKCMANGITIDELAALFGVSKHTIRALKQPQRWKK